MRAARRKVPLIANRPILRNNRITRAAPTARAEVLPLQRHPCSRRVVRRGEALCTTGDPFGMLHVVRSGTFKSFVMSHNGLIQVTGFQIAGDLVGLDGIATRVHQSDVVALEDAEVFVLPFPQCEQWSQDSAFGQHALTRTLAREISRAWKHMLSLGSMRAEQRMVIFLLDLSVRYERLGLSRSQFALGMTRQDIGSYLGLTIETVSRLLSRFQRAGLLQVQGRSIALLDFPALWRIAGDPHELSRPRLDPIVDGEGNLLFTR